MTDNFCIRAILSYFDARATTAADAAALITALDAVVDLLDGINDYLWAKHGRHAIIAALPIPSSPRRPATQLDLFRDDNVS